MYNELIDILYCNLFEQTTDFIVLYIQFWFVRDYLKMTWNYDICFGNKKILEWMMLKEETLVVKEKYLKNPLPQPLSGRFRYECKFYFDVLPLIDNNKRKSKASLFSSEKKTMFATVYCTRCWDRQTLHLLSFKTITARIPYQVW